ncbi:threonine ammonia-lyase, biosynthetic [Corynebacterium kroppenstedtii]|uniref:threonine ammonia-lyase, biosynthetic n=1 Tax=Corynebacterium pseudokroppenstedtii TaxID=2804917 RepID=UPI00194FF424|nr:threonine ammonia-lyase, biosynthetic [Corynebacterium pseudokroppenstedtii]MCF6793708.1 threonine ammonia-lyase, biosynthetic [Corynebacterium pseudokroppenstedtii]MDK7147380.1 threonine ammonia-lyase, biosynthetic [Corynebacterium pseudokroppenstedtii]QRP13704.1 threonine ammonia-lyase, biosynthetic [Corynebacterium kroppenstedtii]
MSPAQKPHPSNSDYLSLVVRAPVYDAAERTLLEPMPRMSQRLGNDVYVKREDTQPVHSFKVRGAYARMAALTDDEKRRGVVTASAGNHAQGIALSGSIMDVSALIVMPTMTPQIKVDAVRNFGGEVLLFGDNFDEAKERASEIAQSEGRVFVPPFDDPHVIAGQGTIGLEIFQQASTVDRVFVPVGGGGLAAGVAVVLKQLNPRISVIGVEPEGSACLTAAMKAGEPVTLDRVSLYAEGVAVARIGDETFRVCRDNLDEVITVNSDEISAAVKDIFDDTRAVAEPSGAVALAGLKKYVTTHGVHGETLAHVLSGANLNFHGLRYISERAELGEHGEALLGVTIPERKGAFLEFCQVLGGRSVTEFNYRVDDNDRARIFVGVQLHEGDQERDDIIADLQERSYDVVDLSSDDAAKEHVRYMIGGRAPRHFNERVFSIQFPEHPGALLHFLKVLGTHWNISLFHYRSHGMDYGRVLCGFDDTENPAGDGSDDDFDHHMQELGYQFKEVTDSVAYTYFLKS